jgi:uncharacterized protein
MGCGYVGSLTVDLHLPEAGSLKDKRKHVQRVKAGLAKRFSCAVAEVDHHDRHRRCRLTLAVVTRTAGDCESLLDAASRWLHGDPAFEVLGEAREIHRADDTATFALGGR